MAGETFTLADAVTACLRRTQGAGALSRWATFRDQECADGNSSKADDTCSGVAQTAGAFAKALGG
ncbi:hypothetical protein OIC43_07855 [Streptomyces sp. NBC_00825]|uniref:hypothetical protein n=1 Tax=unclassified Streptomyces TaxID=2593676 RepID=UPI00224D55FF|nr:MULTISPECIES: hypothetical protein [unclassified Streptomyces]WTB58145.1 hypothetical protein OG832_35850 [Streptomyces sp. NBC_00826]WTH88975.1 hypothetical protein OIC43_07855 [Streptomyces sp. NBC_00825]WTH97705.1 hypothetical protein OHA23_07860 [Streptomyces sp. NBC_00822]MCX4863231.1 hypothetical protein [Streptomyces sp. NBC_00906]MCX4894468.1 hypothetical protein [Streptomyces sp. NBC_00892]